VCQKAGWDCEGYEPVRVFIVSTPKTRQIGYSVAAASGNKVPDKPWQLCRRGQPSRTALTSEFRLLGRVEHESRSIDLFWEAYFPCGRPLPPGIARSYTCGWTGTARKSYRDDDSLRFALWANCLTMHGRRDGVRWMEEEGLKMYMKAVAALRQSLSRPVALRRDSLIAAVKLLGMFEVSNPPLL